MNVVRLKEHFFPLRCSEYDSLKKAGHEKNKDNTKIKRETKVK